MNTSSFHTPSHALAPRLFAGFGTLTLLTGIGLAASRPARTAGGPVAVTVASPVQDRDSPARQPFQTGYTASGFPNGLNLHALTVVPPNKRLIIESMTVNCNGRYDQNTYTADLSGDGGDVGISLIPKGDPYSIITQPVRLTAEAGYTVNAYVYSSIGNTNSVNVSVSGYYVDAP